MNPESPGKGARRYDRTLRAAASAQTRTRLIDAAAALLEHRHAVSLDAVATAAGVTRLTVYNQFKSRCGLLEAVFDARTAASGMDHLADLAMEPDPDAALDRLGGAMSRFWSHDLAICALHDLAGADAELGEALRVRNGRRRALIEVLVGRMVRWRYRGPAAQRNVVDILFALTGQPFHASLAPSRPPAETEAMIQALCRVAISGGIEI